MVKDKGTVLYVGGFELPDKNAAAHRVLSNAKIFKELGYNVIFCGIDKEKSDSKIEEHYGFKSIPIKYPNSLLNWLKYIVDAKKYFQLLEENKDVRLVVCYNLLAIPLAKLLLYCKKRNIKIVADCTEWYENRFSLHPVKFIKFLNTIFAMRVFQKKCDGMIAISSFLKNYYKKYISNIIVLPPLVDITDKKYEHFEDKPLCDAVSLVYCGSPTLKKEALGDVVSALGKIEDINYSFTVVGVTKEQFEKTYTVKINNNKIDFTGRIPHIRALDIVKNNDYSVIIRPCTRVTNAGFPTKFVESITCGTAVIASETSDIVSYFNNGHNGHLVDINNLENDFRRVLVAPKPFVEHDKFDYRSYKGIFSDFLTSLGL